MRHSVVRIIRNAAPLLSLFIFFCSALLSLPPRSNAQRATPRLAARDFFVGKIVLLPRDLRPTSLQQPRLIAQVADHDLITPPSQLLEDSSRAEELLAWAKDFDYAAADGLIVALDALAGTAELTTWQQRLSFLKEIRAQHPRLPIYGYLAFKPSPDAAARVNQTALGLLNDGALDFLLIAPEPGVEAKTTQVSTARLLNEITARKLADRVAFDDDERGAATSLLARMLNQRFGFAPRVLPVYSSNAGREAPATHGLATLGQFISAKLRAIDSRELPPTNESARSVDALLFVHAPNTSEQERLAFTESIAQTIARSVRVALVDLTINKEDKEALLTELRRRKLLDKLFSYASSAPGDGASLEAANRTLAHAAALLVAFRFLRDDYDRVYRIDRAHMRLLFSRYLSDWAYALRVRPALAALVKEKSAADPNWLNNDPARAERFVIDQLQPLAEELFQEQFRRNLHAILLNSGERTQFEVTLLQRLQLRLALPTLEAELNQAIHLAQLRSLPPAAEARTDWSIINERLDERLLRRFYEVEWPIFKTDAELIELNIKLQPGSGAPEAYRIASSRKRDATRRIEITAATTQGAFYGLSRLAQLGWEGQLARDLQLAEAPSLNLRGVRENAAASWSQQERLALLRFMGRARLNQYFYAPVRDETSRLKELLRAAEENFVQLVYVLKPPTSADAANWPNRSINALTNQGVRHFALSLADADQAGNDAELIKRVHAHLQASPDKPTLLIIPPSFTDVARQRSYWSALSAALPPEVLLGVCGPATDAAARETLTAFGRRAVVLDQAVASDPLALQLAAYRSTALPVEQSAGLLITSPPYPYSAQLLLTTAADYAWDLRSYQAERAFERALLTLYDERSRAGVRAWAQTDLARLLQPEAGPGNADTLNQKIATLQTALEAISLTPERGLLRGELAAVLRRARLASRSSSPANPQEKSFNN